MVTSSDIEADEEQDDVVLATKLPIRQMTAIFFCQMNEATQITMPYTIAVYMVRDFLGPAASQAQISRLTGILAASFCAAQFVTSILLGYLSDTYGRKPIVIMSNISSLLSVLGFGIAPTYLLALLARLSGGFCNFTFGCLKSMIGESMDLPTQALALGYLSLSWGFGTILGPSLGGALAQPCQAYGQGFPLCRPGQLFETRPFLLPCMSAAFISFMALLSSLFLLKETLPSKMAQQYTRLQPTEDQQPSLNAGSAPAGKTAQLPSKASRQVRRGDSAEEMHSSALLKAVPTVDELSPLAGTVGIELVPQALVLTALSEQADAEASAHHAKSDQLKKDRSQGKNAGDELELADMQRQPQTADELSEGARNSGSDDKAQNGATHASDDEAAVLIAQDAESSSASPAQQKRSSRDAAALDRQRVWYKERPVQLTILGYGSIAFLYNFVDELTPLFAAAPAAIGGVGLLASQLAVPLVFCGVILMWYAVYGYPWFQRKFGAKFSCRVGLLATAPAVLLIPVAHYTFGSVILAQITLCLILGFKSMGAANSFSGSMIMVNNASPKHAFGKVNGCGQMVASFVRAIGPAGAGLVWGWTTQLQLPASQFLPFAFVAVVSVLTQFLYLFVDLPEA